MPPPRPTSFAKITCRRGKPTLIKVSCEAFELFLRFLSTFERPAGYVPQRLNEVLPGSLSDVFVTLLSVEELLETLEQLVGTPRRVYATHELAQYVDVPLEILLGMDIPAKLSQHVRHPVNTPKMEPVVTHESYIQRTPLGRQYLSIVYLWDIFGLYEQYWTQVHLLRHITDTCRPSDATIDADKVKTWLGGIIPKMEPFDLLDLSNTMRAARRCNGYHEYRWLRDNNTADLADPKAMLKFLNSNSHLARTLEEADERFDAAASMLYEELVKEPLGRARMRPSQVTFPLDTHTIAYMDARDLVGVYVIVYRGMYVGVPHLYQVAEFLLRAHPLRQSLITMCLRYV